MKKKILLISMLLPIGIFIFMVLRDRLFNKNIELLKENHVDLYITSVSKYKSAVILNDTIAIFQGSYRVFPDNNKHFNQDYYKYIESINEPYHLFKKAGSDTLAIIKSNDTLFYKLIPF